MTATTAGDHTAPLLGGRYHFLLRRLHSLTGLVFGGYLVVHLIVNATISTGPLAYQLQVDKLESLPFVRAVEWILIYLPILYHTLYGIWIIVTGQPNVLHYGYGKNWAYLMQRISAVIIAAFLFFHVFALRFNLFGHHLGFDALNAAYTTWMHMHAYPLVAYIVYPIGILASCYHLANGVWTAGITWGLTVSAESQRRWGWACVAIFAITLMLGLVSLITLIVMPQPPSTHI